MGLTNYRLNRKETKVPKSGRLQPHFPQNLRWFASELRDRPRELPVIKALCRLAKIPYLSSSYGRRNFKKTVGPTALD